MPVPYDNNAFRRSSDVVLARMEEKLDNALLRMENQDKKIEHHEKLFHGGNGRTGALIEIDRLKEHKSRAERHWYVVWASAVGLAIKTFWDYFAR